jgi:hypothetical protein
VSASLLKATQSDSNATPKILTRCSKNAFLCIDHSLTVNRFLISAIQGDAGCHANSDARETSPR